MRKRVARTVATVLVAWSALTACAADAVGPARDAAGAGRWREPARQAGLLLAVVLAASYCFAKAEIQIEGAQGWAAGLPTWRIEKHPLLDLFWGGRPLTGYHAWVFTFMAVVFHLPLAFGGCFTPRLEARVLGALAVFWIAEDFLWFVMNPAFGLRRFRPRSVWWHRRWVLGMPLDYVLFLAVGCGLLAYSYLAGGPSMGGAR
jgi:hypothetical protein